MAGSTRRRRWPWVVAAAVVALAAAALIVRAVAFRDEATAVGIERAVKAYRNGTTASPPGTSAAPSTVAAPRVALPAPGVYRYRTTGSESVDVLGGADHGYPAETTITVSTEGCGVLLRWDALRERRDEWRLCTTVRGIELQPVGLQYHEFFSQPDSETVSCAGPVLLIPSSAAGTAPPETQACTLGADHWNPVWVVLAHGRRTINGTSVDVVHVRMTVEDDDEYDEHTVVDWFLDASGLPIEASSTKESRSPSPIGAVSYHEQYDLALESLTPLS